MKCILFIKEWSNFNNLAQQTKKVNTMELSISIDGLFISFPIVVSVIDSGEFSFSVFTYEEDGLEKAARWIESCAYPLELTQLQAGTYLQ